MSENDYDVIIVGSGPAGGQAARDLSKSSTDLDVCVLEKDSYIGETRQSTGGTFPRMTSEFDIEPDKVSMNVTDTATLEGPTQALDLEQRGYVLDFGEFKKYLADEAKDNGAEYLLNSKVVGLDQEIEEGLGVVTNILDDNSNKQKTYTADVVIDASGAHAVLGQDLGLVDYDISQDLAKGVEYEMEGVEMDKGPSRDIGSEDTMMFKVDSEYAPGGYSWIFYTGEDTAKVGVCWYNKYFKEKGGDGTTEQYFKKFWDEDPRLQNAEKIVKDGKEERHAGKAFIKQLDSFVDDRLILAGDTISSIEPVWGEGIHNCLKSGRIAAETVREANRAEDFSKDELRLYEEKWHDRIGDSKDERMELADILYRLSDKNFDRLLKSINNYDNDELLKLTSLDDKSKMKDVFKDNAFTALHMVKDQPRVVGKVLKQTYLH